MNVVLWILQIVLGAIMLMAGAMKATRGREGLLSEPRMAWVEDYPDSTVRGIGVAELLAGIGLIFPWWLDILPILTPLAAVGIVVVMVLAIRRHMTRSESHMFPVNGTIALIALVIAIGRFADL